MRGIQEKPLITGNKKNLLEKTDKNIFVRNRAYEIICRRKWFRSNGEHRKRKIEIKRKSGKGKKEERERKRKGKVEDIEEGNIIKKNKRGEIRKKLEEELYRRV